MSVSPAAGSIVALLLGIGACCLRAGEEAPVEPPPGVDRNQIIDRQLDASLEARDIERVLGKLKKASDLSKQRITDAAVTAENASGALQRGDSAAARIAAAEAAVMFKEIANQLEALLADETPKRIAAARDLAEQLSLAEREFLKQFPGMLNANGEMKGKVDPQSMPRKATGEATGGKPDDSSPEKSEEPGDDKTGEDNSGKDKMGETSKEGSESEKNGGTDPNAGEEPATEGAQGQGKQGDSGEANPDGEGGAGKGDDEEKGSEKGAGSGQPLTAEERREQAAQRAEQLGEQAQTLMDILKAIMQSTDPADQEAIRKVEAIVRETELEKSIEALNEAAGLLRSDKAEDVKLAGMDAADRLEIAAQRLDSAYRTIVAPQAEELRKLEEALAMLSARLEQLETPSQIGAWHREARAKLDDLDRLGVAGELRKQLEEAMKQAGFEPGTTSNLGNWAIGNGRYIAPEEYRSALLQIQEEIQERIQLLLVGDVRASPDDPTPPKYRDLVNRYYEVLSRDSSTRK